MTRPAIRLVQGYTNMGWIDIPPLPYYTVLTDRDDGTLWTLIHDATGVWLGLDDTPLPANAKARIYPALEGPAVLEEPHVRLLVRGGRLGFEVLPHLPEGFHIHLASVLTRRGNERKTFEIKGPASRDVRNPLRGTLAQEEVVF